MEKSADAFRTISEVAVHLDVPQHVLRFWETRFLQIRPMKRAGGRRYYRPADVVLLHGIRRLLYEQGYTIKGVQRLLKEKGHKGLDADRTNGVELDELGPDDPSTLTRSDADASGPSRPPILSRQEPPTFILSGPDEAYAALEQVLIALEECERIIAAVRSPAAE